jgi:hypothetical protein
MGNGTGESESGGKDFVTFIDSLEDDHGSEQGGNKDSETKDTLTSDKLETEIEGEGEKDKTPVTTEEGAKGGEGEKRVDLEKEVYTPEELDDLLKTDGEIDTSRLSPEGKLLMKSFQRGYDSKFKALAEERRVAQEKTLTPKEKLFREYLQDPGKVMADINKEIAALEETPHDHADFLKNRRTIVQLQAVKDEFRENRQMVLESQRSKDSLYARTMASVLEDIPDWREKEPKMTKFAVEQLGLTLEDVRVMSDPAIMGDRTIRFIKAVNRAYDRFNAKESAGKKEVKTAPKPLGRAGEAGGEAKKTKTLDEMPYDEYKAHREKQLKEQSGV